MRVLELGCGENKIKMSGAKVIGLDKKLTKDTDVICDLEKEKIPFQKNYFDRVYAIHFLEHLDEPFKVVKDVYRVLKNNGIFIAHVPFFTSCAAHDADHKRFFNYCSFEYFTGDKKNYPEYKSYKFEMIKRKIIFSLGKYDKFVWPITKPITFLINLFPKFFQNTFLAYLLPSCYLVFEMKKME